MATTEDGLNVGVATPGNRAAAAARSLRNAAPIVIAGLVVLAGILGARSLSDRAEEARGTQVLVSHVEAAAHRQGALEWEAIAEGHLSAENRAEIADARLDMERSAHAVPDAVRGLLLAYQAAVNREFELLGAGDVERAEEVDEELVDPRFEALEEALTRLGRESRERADRAERQAELGIVTGLAGVVAIAAVLVGGAARRSRRAAVALERERTLGASERRFRTLVQHSADMIAVIDDDGRIGLVTDSCRQVLGLLAGSLIGTPFSDLLHPDDRPHLQAALADADAGPRTGRATLELRMRHADGSWRHTESVVADLRHDAGVRGIVLTTRDVSERRALQEELAHQAFHDGLTGLANRALFHDQVERALRRRTGRDQVAVLFLDLDEFKEVNDSHGHAAGDELLVGVADRLARSLREADVIARLGGDEFAILVEGDRPGLADIGRRILEALDEPVPAGGHEVQVRASVGIALGEGARDAEELLRNADVAMYLAKSQGKGRLAFYEQDQHEELLRRAELMSDLRDAVTEEQFVVHYQPIVALGSGRVVGMEALVRWAHPRRGLLAPREFIDLAEQSGLIVPIGRLVLIEACRQARRWQASRPTEPPMAISVNVSGRQLDSPGLADAVREALEQSGLEPAHLVLELTESLLVEESRHTVILLEALKEIGVKLAIDDFGKGYSSLSYLGRLPVDRLKIDKVFIDDVHRSGEASALVETIIRLAETFGLETVAEGVEMAEQVASLRALGCPLGQGYRFGRPLDPVAMEMLLAEDAGLAPVGG